MNLWHRIWAAIRNRPLPAPVVVPARPMTISAAAKWEAQRGHTPASDGVATFAPCKPAPGVVPAMAMDSLPALTDAGPIASWAMQQTFHEGLQFAGYPYLAELAQRAEYRKIAEKWAEHATRKWIKLRGDEAKVEAIRAEFDRLNVRMMFREALEHDGLFGRAQIFLDFDDADDVKEIATPLTLDARKVSKKRPLQRIKTVEPMWSYPARYETRNPLSAAFYKPQGWWVYGRTVHASRLLTIVGREVPDMLKPAYAFGGLSLTQMAKPYVDNWLRARQDVSDLINAFSTMVLATDMSQLLTGGDGANVFERTDLFNATRDNRGAMVIDKNSESLTNVSAPLGSLDKLQAQAQEQMASVSSLPLIVLLGITPSGLNASSEGELRTFYADVKAYQEKVCRHPVHTILQLVQLSLFDEIDPAIGFDFEDLWEMSDADKAAIRKSDAECDGLYIDKGVVDADDTRERINDDEASIYHGRLSGPAPGPPEAEGGDLDSGEDDDVAMLRAA